LPDVVTVTLSGLTKSNVKLDLLSLSFSSCFGSGAAGDVNADGGLPNEGFPIHGVTLTSGGSGYAKLGRVAPTLTITGIGTGATFTPTFESKNDACGIPTWSIKSISASGGTGYANDETLSITTASGTTQEQAAVATISTVRVAPTLSASAPAGSGAAFSVSTSPNSGAPATWSVSGVTITSGGTGYPAAGMLTITPATGDTQDSPALIDFFCGRVAPTVAVAITGSGSGAVLSGTLSSGTDYFGRTYWYISSVSVTNGGSGYSEYDEVTATVTDGVSGGYSYFYALASVDGGGAVTGVTVYDGGEYFKSNGIIESVEIDDPGSYHRDTLAVESVTIHDSGRYYREDSTEPPYVADVTATVGQLSPSDGGGAEITATVEANTSSPNFGKITGLTLDDGGDGYLGWTWAECDVKRLNGRAILIERSLANRCIYQRCLAGGTITVEWRGFATPPLVLVNTDCQITFTADEADAPFSCTSMSFIATEPLGGTALVEAGGGEIPTCQEIYDATSIDITMTGEDATVFGKCSDDSASFASKSTGSRYNGTFSCQRIEGSPLAPPGVRYFEYEIGELCGVMSKVGVFVGPPSQTPFPRFQVVVTGVISYRAENYASAAQEEFACGPVGFEWNGVSAKPASNKWVRVFDLNFQTSVSCACDMESFSAQWQALFIGGSDNRSYCEYELVSIEGDSVIRVIRAEIGG
jgi:hypothetical protein